MCFNKHGEGSNVTVSDVFYKAQHRSIQILQFLLHGDSILHIESSLCWDSVFHIKSSLCVEICYFTLNPTSVLRFSTPHWTLPVFWDSVLHIGAFLCFVPNIESPCVLGFNSPHWILSMCWNSVFHIEYSLCVKPQYSTLNPPRVLYSTFPFTSGTYKNPESEVELILPVRGVAVGLWLSWIASVHCRIENCIVLIFRRRWKQMAASAPRGGLISI